MNCVDNFSLCTKDIKSCYNLLNREHSSLSTAHPQFERKVVTMSDFLDAYGSLFRTANHGAEYYYQTIPKSEWNGHIDSDLWARGYTLTSKVVIPDVVEGQSVDATVDFDLMATVDGTLFLRTIAYWTRSDGKEHGSLALWNISREAAELIDRLLSTDESLETVTSEPRPAIRYGFDPYGEIFGAICEQILPSKSNDDIDHHTAVIMKLIGIDMPGTEMLTHWNGTAVDPEYLIVLNQWMQNVPVTL